METAADPFANPAPAAVGPGVAAAAAADAAAAAADTTLHLPRSFASKTVSAALTTPSIPRLPHLHRLLRRRQRRLPRRLRRRPRPQQRQHRQPLVAIRGIRCSVPLMAEAAASTSGLPLPPAMAAAVRSDVSTWES